MKTALLTRSLPKESSPEREHSLGCWSGWLIDQELMKQAKKNPLPESYFGLYPRSQALTLNTWLSGFGLYSHGLWLKLDRHGSILAKELIKKSPRSSGYWVSIKGKRKDNHIEVSRIIELEQPAPAHPILDGSDNRRKILVSMAKMWWASN